MSKRFRPYRYATSMGFELDLGVVMISVGIGTYWALGLGFQLSRYSFLQLNLGPIGVSVDLQ